jgi:hypothetical protein
VSGQTKVLDSLRDVVYSVPAENQLREAYVDHLFEYQKAYLVAVNYDSIQAIANRAFRIANQLKTTKSLGKAHMMLGRFYSKKKQDEQALKHYLKSRALLQELSDQKLKFICDSEIGAVYFSKGYLNKELDSALLFFEKAVNQSKAIDEVYQVKSLHQLSLAHLVLGNFEASRKYIKQLSEVPREQQGELYYNVSLMNFFEFQNNKDSALFYGKKSYEEYNKNEEIPYDVAVWAAIKYANCFYSFYEDDSAKVYFEQAIVMALEKGDVISYSKAFGPLNFLYSVKGDSEASMRLCQQAINWGQKVGDSALIAQAMYNSTFVYGKLENYQEAINIYIELLRAYDQFLPIPTEVAYTNLSYNYYEILDYLNAIKYATLSKEIDTSNPTTFYNLADAILGAYLDTTIQKKHVLEHLNVLPVSGWDEKQISDTILNLVRSNYTIAVDLIENQENKRILIHPYYGLGDYYEVVGNQQKAAFYYEQSWRVADGTEMMELSNKIKIARKLYWFYRNETQQLTKALEWIEVLDSLKDEEKKSENLELLGRQQAEFEYSQKIYTDSLELVRQNEIEVLKEQQKEEQQFIVVAFSVLLAIVLLIVMYLFFRRKALKSENKLISLEQKLLRTQMNPHFIFNSLTTIGGFIVANRVNDSYNYISQFSKLIRLILESSRKEEITLESELIIIENFLSLHQMNKKEELSYEVNYKKEILDEEIMIPPMLLQPFIENAVKYGEMSASNACKVVINFELKGKELYCSVRDFGEGFSPSNEKKGSSYSIQITKERIATIKSQIGKAVRLNIVDLSNSKGEEKGVLVEIFVQV